MKKNNNTKKEEKNQSDDEQFDLITIVSSEEKEVPEMKPPSGSSILFDYIPEIQQTVTAVKEDHVSKTTEHSH